MVASLRNAEALVAASRSRFSSGGGVGGSGGIVSNEEYHP